MLRAICVLSVQKDTIILTFKIFTHTHTQNTQKHTTRNWLTEGNAIRNHGGGTRPSFWLRVCVVRLHFVFFSFPTPICGQENEENNTVGVLLRYPAWVSFLGIHTDRCKY